MGGRENRRGFFVAKSDQVVLPIELAPDDVLRVLLHKAQTFDWPTWALFLTAYVYFGYLAK